MNLHGGLWASTDKRCNRIVRVITATINYAVVKQVDHRGLDLPHGRTTRVRRKPNGDLDRYRRHQPKEQQ